MIYSLGFQLKGSRGNSQNSLHLEAVGVAKSVQEGTKILCPPHASPFPPLGGEGVLKQRLFFIHPPIKGGGFLHNANLRHISVIPRSKSHNGISLNQFLFDIILNLFYFSQAQVGCFISSGPARPIFLPSLIAKLLGSERG
jgi:hypothetical protein